MATDIENIGFAPPHPGEYLREDILPALGFSIKALAEHLDVSRQSLSELLHEKRSVSMEMAQRLGKAFKNGTRFWLALQLQHDLWIAENNGGVNVSPIDWDEQDVA